MKTYGSPEICEKLGIKTERLRQWVKLGYVSPLRRRKNTSGVPNEWTIFHIYNIRLLQVMADAGIRRKVATFFFCTNSVWLDPPVYVQRSTETVDMVVNTRKIKRYVDKLFN